MPLSYSRIRTFMQCKRQFKFQYIDNLPYPETGPLRIGKAVHTFMENYGKHCIGSFRARDIDYASKESKRIMGSMDPEDAQQFEDIVDRAIATHDFTPALIEERFSLDADWKYTKWDSARLRGIIDWHKEEGKIVKVIDYKTDRRIQPYTEVEQDLQLRVYVLALAAMYPNAEVFEASKDFIRYGKVIGPVVFKKAQLDDFKTYIGGILTNIENEKDFFATVGSACNWCPYCRKCEAYKAEDPDFRDKLDTDKASRLAEWVYRTEKKAKEAREKLQAFVDSSEKPIYFGDMMMGYTAREERSVKDSQELVSELIRRGVKKEDIWEYINFSKTSMEKALKKNGKRDLIAELTDKHFAVTTKTIFQFKKKIGDDEE